jgi:hypothetical protein
MVSFTFELNKSIVASDIVEQNQRLDVILTDRLKRALDDYEELLRHEKEAMEGLIK